MIALLSIVLIKVEVSQSWNLYAAGMQNVKAGDAPQALLQAIGSAFKPVNGEFVIIVGGSTDRELSADDGLVSKVLSDRCRRDIHVVNLGSSSQTFSESWSAIALAPENRQKLILVGINPYRLSMTDDDVVAQLVNNATGIPNSFSLLWNVWLHTGNLASLERFARSIARQESLGAKWNLRDLFFPSEAAPMRAPENPYQPFRSVYQEPVWTRAEKLREANEYIAARVLDFHENYLTGVKWYKGLLDHFKTSNTDLKFLVLPTDESFDRPNALVARDFGDALRRLGGNQTVIDLTDQQKVLTASDFFDVQHLVARGRKRLQPVLIEAISNALGCLAEPSQ